MMNDLLIAANPDPDSRLPYLLRLPLGRGMVFRTAGTWPRTKALFCYPVSIEEWPDDPQIVEQVPIRSCARHGAAIDLVLARGRENRSQLVFTTARGREAVFWQSPRTRKQARPNVTTPTARAAGIADLEIVIDTREQYPYRFSSQQVHPVRRALPCGDYAITVAGQLVAAVERKSLPDLVASLTDGTLRYALGELAALPRAAVVVEDRYSQDLQTRPDPARGRRRRARRTADPLAHRPHRVRRDQTARRRMDLPLPRRRTRLGAHRTRDHRPHPHRTRDRGRPASAATRHSRGPPLGPHHRTHRSRSRSTRTAHLAGLARRPRTHSRRRITPSRWGHPGGSVK
jgi:hypothetical protein